MDDPRTPVSLVTGWLGAGKTTLLNRLLQEPGDARYAVLVNEFGDIGIDHRLVVRADEDLVELSNGCVCCTVRGDLVRALDKLHRKARPGLLRRGPRFHRVLLETTGVAEPAPLLRTFLVESAIAARYRVASVVTLVDARNAARSLAHRSAAEQIALADLLLLNKTDLADAAAVAALEPRLRRTNPTAPILPCHHSDVPAREVFRERPPMDGHLQDSRSEPGAGGAARSGTAEHEAGSDHLQGLAPVSLVEPRPLDELQTELWLRACVRFFGERLVRYKGFLHLAGHGHRAVLQGTYDLFQVDAGEAWADGERTTELVFIGHDLDADMLRRGLEACVAQSS